MDFEQTYRRELSIAADCNPQKLTSLEQAQRAYGQLCREYKGLLKRFEIVYSGEDDAAQELWQGAAMPKSTAEEGSSVAAGGFPVAILHRLVGKGFSMSKRHRLAMSLLAIRLVDKTAGQKQTQKPAKEPTEEEIWRNIMPEGLVRQEDSYAVAPRELLFYLPMINIFQGRIVADRLAAKLKEKIRNYLGHDDFALAMGIADNRVKDPQRVEDMWHWLYRALAGAEQALRQDPSLTKRTLTAIECRS